MAVDGCCVPIKMVNRRLPLDSVSWLCESPGAMPVLQGGDWVQALEKFDRDIETLEDFGMICDMNDD